MSRVIRQIEYSTRSVSMRGVVVFSSMGKYVTDFLRQFKGPGWTVTSMTEAEYEADNGLSAVSELETLREKLRVAEAAVDELGCVVDVLDNLSVPTEIAPGEPYSVHGRVGDAITKARDDAGTRNTPRG